MTKAEVTLFLSKAGYSADVWALLPDVSAIAMDGNCNVYPGAGDSLKRAVMFYSAKELLLVRDMPESDMTSVDYDKYPILAAYAYKTIIKMQMVTPANVKVPPQWGISQ